MGRQSQSYKFHLLLHSADLIEDYLRIKLSPLDLTPRQARVLKALNRLGPVAQVELARSFGITAASMSTMTARLIALGFIKSDKDPDNAKRNIISLTTQGAALLDDISKAWKETDNYMEEKIGSDNLQKLAELSQMLRDSLGGSRPEIDKSTQSK